MRIRTAKQNDTRQLATLITESFRDIAERFGLTPENAPTHPSNCNEEKVRADLGKGVTYYIAEADNQVVGCVALEPGKDNTWYLERLAVLPSFRRRGIGQALVGHALTAAYERGAQEVSIGIIAKHTELRSWYETLGFVLTGTKMFEHLPFEVAFLVHRRSGGPGLPSRRHGSTPAGKKLTQRRQDAKQG